MTFCFRDNLFEREAASEISESSPPTNENRFYEDDLSGCGTNGDRGGTSEGGGERSDQQPPQLDSFNQHTLYESPDLQSKTTPVQ